MWILLLYIAFNLIALWILPTKFWNKYNWVFYFLYPMILLFPFLEGFIIIFRGWMSDMNSTIGYAWDITDLISKELILLIIAIIIFQFLFNNYIGKIINKKRKTATNTM